MINYWRKSNLFPASKWVGRALLRRRRPLCCWAWADDPHPAAFLSRQGEQKANLLWQLGHPEQGMSQACCCHSQHARLPKPGGAAQIMDALARWQLCHGNKQNSLCPLLQGHSGTPQASPSLQVEAHYFRVQTLQALSKLRGVCMCVCKGAYEPAPRAQQVVS